MLRTLRYSALHATLIYHSVPGSGPPLLTFNAAPTTSGIAVRTPLFSEIFYHTKLILRRRRIHKSCTPQFLRR